MDEEATLRRTLFDKPGRLYGFLPLP